MSDVLVVGSIALDTVSTPAGKVDEVLGGSATYFSYAASFFGPVRLMGVVGEDFPDKNLDILKEHSVDVSGVQKVPGKTFRWSGSYDGDMAEATTKHLELNVFESFRPDIPEKFQDTEFVFLANGDPETQLHLLDQLQNARFVACDSMNHWIESSREALLKVLKRAEGFVLNDGEARLLTGEDNLIRAGNAIRTMGPKAVIIKKGPHGACLFASEGYFVAPAYPTEDVVDPTGAGDSFGGGLMGYLASKGAWDWTTLKRGVLMGTAVASFNVEGFSFKGFSDVKLYDIIRRSEELLTFSTV